MVKKDARVKKSKAKNPQEPPPDIQSVLNQFSCGMMRDLEDDPFTGTADPNVDLCEVHQDDDGELTLYLEVNFSTAIRLDALLNYVDLQHKKGEIVKRLRDKFRIA